MKKQLFSFALILLFSLSAQARCFNDQRLRDTVLEGIEMNGLSCTLTNEGEIFNLDNKAQIYFCNSRRESVSVKIQSTMVYEPGLLGPCFSTKSIDIKKI